METALQMKERKAKLRKSKPPHKYLSEFDSTEEEPWENLKDTKVRNLTSYSEDPQYQIIIPLKVKNILLTPEETSNSSS